MCVVGESRIGVIVSEHGVVVSWSDVVVSFGWGAVVLVV